MLRNVDGWFICEEVVVAYLKLLTRIYLGLLRKTKISWQPVLWARFESSTPTYVTEVLTSTRRQYVKCGEAGGILERAVVAYFI
jgi:hypothetical protein